MFRVWSNRLFQFISVFQWSKSWLSRGMLAMSTKKGGVPLRGIKNLGNTCYINAILQCLASIPAFMRYLRDKQPESCNTPFAFQLLTLLESLRPCRDGYIVSWPASTEKIMELVTSTNVGSHFANREQHDSLEFLQCILALLEAEECEQKPLQRMQLSLRGIASGGGGMAQLLDDKEDAAQSSKNCPFQGLASSQLVCRKCQMQKTIRHEKFTHLSLPIPAASPRTLHGCFEEHNRREFLDEVECGACSIVETKMQLKERIELIESPSDAASYTLLQQACLRGDEDSFCAEVDLDAALNQSLIEQNHIIISVRCTMDKNIYLSRLPDVLCLQLSRKSVVNRGKNSAFVAVPPTLRFAHDGTSFRCSPPTTSNGATAAVQYDLCAVVIHHGADALGHYTAHVKSPTGRSWMHADDARGHFSKDDEVFSSNAYILFYCKTDSVTLL